MFKTLLLHIIYENCIEVAFDSIQRSFSVAPEIYKVGKYYDVLDVAYEGSRNITQLLWHCHIDAIYGQTVKISHSEFEDPQRHTLYVTNVNIYDISIPKESLVSIYLKFEDYSKL